MSRLATTDLVRWSGGHTGGSVPDHVEGVFHDSRSVLPGCLFAAVSGERFDGHDFVATAFADGAALALVERPVDGPCLIVPSVRQALLDLARGYRATFQIPVVGVTGSVGKTTVKELLADLLGTLGPTARNPGNWNNDLGLPLSVLNMPNDSTHAVFEIGMNHPGELAPLCEVIQPTHAIVTEIGMAHIEFFDDITGIAEEKATLLRALGPEGVYVLDTASEWFDFLAARCKGRATVVDSTRDTLPAPFSLPGDHMVRNALKAVAIARALGVDQAGFDAVLPTFQPPGMRWRQESHEELHFINDAYNANPMSMRAALDAVRDIETAGTRWLILGEMGELGDHAAEAHAEIGRYAAGGPWRLISVGEAAAEISQYSDGQHVVDPEGAAKILHNSASPGDLVLLKGSRTAKLESVIDLFCQLKKI